MTKLNQNDPYIPLILYIDYINAEYNKYLKKNFENITPRDFSYLINIFYHPNISQRELSDLLIVSEANVGQIVKRLEKNGLIYREFDKQNKSRRLITLTDYGEKVVQSLLDITRVWEKNFFKKYTPNEEKKFREMISDYYQKSINK